MVSSKLRKIFLIKIILIIKSSNHRTMESSNHRQISIKIKIKLNLMDGIVSLMKYVLMPASASCYVNVQAIVNCQHNLKEALKTKLAEEVPHAPMDALLKELEQNITALQVPLDGGSLSTRWDNGNFTIRKTSSRKSDFFTRSDQPTPRAKKSCSTCVQRSCCGKLEH